MRKIHLHQIVLLLAVVSAGVIVGSACQGTIPPLTDPAGFVAAVLARGGAMYDKWWNITGATEPTSDHPLWASRPDTTTNTRTGADTWRCKECHGWDYKGVDGVYGSGSHQTGIKGIRGTTKTPQEVFDLIKTNHSFDTVLSDADIWDLAKFVLQGTIDTSTIIDSSGAFTGNATTGKPLYDNGIGTSIACAVCHGADGKQILFHGTDTLGGLANENPWEVQHKIRFGQPGTAMPASVTDGGTTQNVNDVGAHSQTLPQAP